MNKFAVQPVGELAAYFEEAASRRNLAFRIIEKDFWVCWTLRQLFDLPEIGPNLLFKGGTSLSKVYGVIERFSEDIDVSINRDFLGFGGSADPLVFEGSNRKRAEQINDLKLTCRQWVRTDLQQSLRQSFASILGESGKDSWQLTVDDADNDGQTLLFAYPTERNGQNPAALEYLRPVVKIEMGARAAHYPAEWHSIKSYAAEEFPAAFDEPDCKVKVLAAERTFWEKATILHDQYHRAADGGALDRISRHYYDLYKLAQTPIAERAINNIELLRDVVENKKIFFTRAGANYDEALTGELRLSPNDARLPGLQSDYNQMGIMFFGDAPKFDRILQTLAELESRINTRVLKQNGNDRPA